MTARALRVTEGGARVYRSTWRASVVSTFANPVLFLLAMGVGLGSLVDDGGGTATLDIDYLKFLAPGLLAATAMQTGAGDGSYPVMAGIKWRKTYEAILATPISLVDLVLGHIGWVTIRLVFVTVVYAGVMTAFGATTPLEALLAVPPAVLTGTAITAAVTAYTANLKDETGLSAMFRFAILPMFLFSGTFFPVSQLPDYLEPVAWGTPLFHGVSLCRGLALDGVAFEVLPAFSVAYLLGFTAIATALAIRVMRRRLVL